MLKNDSISDLSPFGLMRAITFAQDPFKTDVASFFEPSVNGIVKAVLDQRRSAYKMISVSLTQSCFDHI